jgi:hypothetical protein
MFKEIFSKTFGGFVFPVAVLILCLFFTERRSFFVSGTNRKHHWLMNIVQGRQVQERVLTGGNAGKNHVPSCAESVSGLDQTRVCLDYWTGRWST